MATWTRREFTRRRIEYLAPVPAAYADVCKAIEAAEFSYRQEHGGDPMASLPDDALTVTVTDDAVVIAFTVDLDKPTTAA